MAAFPSREPNIITSIRDPQDSPHSWLPSPRQRDLQVRTTTAGFNLTLSGTSMPCPCISGIAGLLRTHHPPRLDSGAPQPLDPPWERRLLYSGS
uniref:Uncharacterized protein n=1 Tax=Nelumbo nucifera TaxID=4432 RepID=A0A822XX62_NELNU|nr:TPA_asm: hypothetical protein HUJ06_025777 [Nelumbo nucifera]